MTPFLRSANEKNGTKPLIVVKIAYLLMFQFDPPDKNLSPNEVRTPILFWLSLNSPFFSHFWDTSGIVGGTVFDFVSMLDLSTG